MTGLVTFRYDLVIGKTKIYTRRQKTGLYANANPKPYTLGLVNACNPTKILNMTRSQFAKNLLEPRTGYVPVILPVEWVHETWAILRFNREDYSHLTAVTVTL